MIGSNGARERGSVVFIWEKKGVQHIRAITASNWSYDANVYARVIALMTVYIQSALVLHAVCEMCM